MNIQAPNHFRYLLVALLLGAQWGGILFASYQATLSKKVSLGETPAHISVRLMDAHLSAGNDFSPLPAWLRFSGKTPVGLEDTLNHLQETISSGSHALPPPFDVGSDFSNTQFVGSTALVGQSLLLQHTRLQI